MPILQALSDLARPWADLYGESTALATLVEFTHIAALLVAGGFALAFDRSALRIAVGHVNGRASFAGELAAVHRPVMLGLALVVLSGLALMAADVESMLPSRVFWSKMCAFGLLLVNGFFIRRVGHRLEVDPRDALSWRSLQRGSRRSVALWMLVLFLGVLLRSAA
ncbi:MAG: hypothetical protein PVH00_02045 [Gemmatimonadota bacterium]|jgi:hypothetical protein